MPTSRATRVTSEAKEESWSTIVLTVLAVERNSPLSGRPSASSAIDWERSPLATAPITRAVSLMGWTRSPISALTDCMEAAQEPPTPAREARSDRRPCLPTAWLKRSSSRLIA